MIVIKTIIGLSIIVLTLSMLYLIGRITIPRIDPDWRRHDGQPQHYVIVMLAGIVGCAAIGLICTLCLLGYAVGEAVMQQIQ